MVHFENLTFFLREREERKKRKELMSVNEDLSHTRFVTNQFSTLFYDLLEIISLVGPDSHSTHYTLMCTTYDNQLPHAWT